ncbi:MAG: CTP synthase, partial [Xanthomonadales bacterium]|nr:CTP synthase [Xanthomonadales bacterium]
TVGDIEGLPFMEAVRQFRHEVGRANCCCVHLAYIPYIKAAGEIKTKPTQHSVKELRNIGIQADVLLCRSEQPLPDAERRKIALFTNVPEKAVISAVDLPSIYQIPEWLQQQGLDQLAVDQLRLAAAPVANLAAWHEVCDREAHPKARVTVAIVGKYVEHKDAYKSLGEALKHGGLKQSVDVDLRWIECERVESEGTGLLAGVDAILVPGGFGKRGFEGKIAAARHARTQQIPYFGICYGLHAAVVDFARNVAGLADANSTENDRSTLNPVIGLITEWRSSSGAVEQRSESSDLGGTMRLGAQDCRVQLGTLAFQLYGKEVVSERHRHRYEFNNRYLERFAELGMVFSGKSMDDSLVEMIEYRDHPWFLACQAHPEFLSTPLKGHPLFIGFITAALAYQRNRQPHEVAA